MRRIPVLVVGLRGILAEIVTQVLKTQDDFEVLHRARPDEVLAAAHEHDVRLVLLELNDGELPPLGAELLAARPSLKVLGIEAHGRSASLYELKPVRTPLGELSAEKLAEAVRAAACG